jgi:hypothetical protein
MTGTSFRNGSEDINKRRQHVRTKTTFTILMTVAVMFATVAVGYAGGGGAGLGGGVIFQCYDVEGGTAPPQVLSIDDDLTAPATVSLGKPKMVCTLSSATVTNGAGLNAVTVGDHFTCYQTRGQAGGNQQIQILDTLSQQSLKVGSSDFVCVSADRLP